MRITGLSGLDVDSMVKEMMKPYNIKVDKQKQQRDLIGWKQDVYRDVTKNMKGLYNKYLDVLSKDYILSPSKLSSAKATSTDPSIVDASALSGAKSGTYSVTVDNLATTAKVASDANIKSEGINTKIDISGLPETSPTGGRILTFNINGTSKDVIINDNSAGVTVGDLITSINSTVKDLGVQASYSEFSGKLTMETTKSGSNNSLGITGLENIKVNGTKLFSDGTRTSNYGELVFATNNLNEKLTGAGGCSVGDKLTIGTSTIIVEAEDTVQSFIDKIKLETGKDVSISQPNFDGKVKFCTGTESNITFSNNAIALNKTSDNKMTGTNANYSITLPDGTVCPNQTSTTNAFTKDNITFTLNSKGTTTFTVKNDVSGTVDTITNFVDDYNKLVDDMYSKTTTPRNKLGEYLPLSEDQKKDMSEEQIKSWEEKGKKGLLKGDMLLNSISADMRGVFDSYTGMGKELKKIGISLSADMSKPNHIQIDKDKLKTALENDGENVINMLISTEKVQGKKPNGDPMVDNSGKPVMVSKGAFAKIKDITYKTCMVYKSKLVEKAGSSDSTSVSDELSKDITKRNDKIKQMLKDLQKREQGFYTKFSALEQAMNKLNAQQQQFAKQFGGA